MSTKQLLLTMMLCFMGIFYANADNYVIGNTQISITQPGNHHITGTSSGDGTVYIVKEASNTTDAVYNITLENFYLYSGEWASAILIENNSTTGTMTVNFIVEGNNYTNGNNHGGIAVRKGEATVNFSTSNIGKLYCSGQRSTDFAFQADKNNSAVMNVGVDPTVYGSALLGTSTTQVPLLTAVTGAFTDKPLVILLSKKPVFEVNGIWYRNVGNDTVEVVVGLQSYSGDIVIPDSVTHESNKYVVTGIGESAFYNCTGLTGITIPGSIIAIGDSAFANCTALRKVTVLDTVPLTINANVFAGSSISNDTLIVPIGKITAYEAKDVWEDFGVIRENIPDGPGGETGDLSWEIEGGVLTISGDGEMPDYNSDEPAPWADYIDDITSIVIEEGVENIGDSAFIGCTEVTSVTIAASVESIGDAAFKGCTDLEEVIALNPVPVAIDSTVFAGVDLENAKLLVAVGKEADYRAADIWEDFGKIPSTDATFKDIALSVGTLTPAFSKNVTSYTATLDYKTTGLIIAVTANDTNAKVTGDGSKSIAAGTNKFIVTVTAEDGRTKMNDTITIINNSPISWIIKNDTLFISGTDDMPNHDGENPAPWLIAKDNFTTVVIMDGITNIGEYAFADCDNITSVSIPATVTSIEDSAFASCTGLTSFTIPNTITDIEDNAFAGCSNLASITSLGSTPPVLGANVFADVDNTIPVYVPCVNLNAYKTAWTYFSNIQGLDVTIASGTDGDITWSVVAVCIGHDTVLTISGKGAMVDNSRPWSLYWNNVNEIVIENGITHIGNLAFYGCKNPKSVIIPNSVTSIGNYAFQECWGLTSLTIPNSVKSIGNSAFYNCSGIISLIIPNSVESIDNAAFFQCFSIDTLVIGNSVKTIGNSAFEDCRELTSVTIGNSVETIGNYAFKSCNKLTSLTIPNSVETIGNSAFEDCGVLTSLVLGKSVINIGDYAFHACTNLTSLTIPNSVETIGLRAFKDCTGLTSLDLGKSVKTIGDEAFLGCSGLTSLVIPNSVETIGNYAFDQCPDLENIVVGSSVESIGDYAFAACSNIRVITSLAVTPPTLGSGVFNSTTAPKTIVYIPCLSDVAAYELAWAPLTNFRQEVLIEAVPYNFGDKGNTVTIEGSNDDGMSNCESEVTLTAKAVKGYRFFKWLDNDSRENPRTVTASEHTTFKAVFTTKCDNCD